MSAINDRPNWKTYLERSSMMSTTTSPSPATTAMMHGHVHGQDDMMIKTSSKKASTPATSSRLSRNLRSLITSASNTAVAATGFSLAQKDDSGGIGSNRGSNDKDSSIDSSNGSSNDTTTTTTRTTNTSTATINSSSSPSDKRTSRSMAQAIISAYKSVSPKVFSNLGPSPILSTKEDDDDSDDDGRGGVDPSLQAAHHHSIDVSTSDRDGQVNVSAREKQPHDGFKVSCTSIYPSIHP